MVCYLWIDGCTSEKGILTPEEIQKAILEAERVSPSAPGNDRDDETKQLLTSLKASLGNE